MINKTLGIIGGMGALATVNLFEKIVLLTDAKSDQEHLHILIDNNTRIPDRTSFILGNGENPREYLIDSAKKLQEMGADFLIMPCNTAHYSYDDIVKEIDIPFLSMIEETAKYIKSNYKNKTNIGLLATEGTYKSEVYDKTFKEYGINIIKPSILNQKHIMDFIYDIKKGIKHNDLTGYYLALEEIKSQDVDLFIIGCTELSVALKLYDLKGDYVDPIEIIASSAIEFAGGKVLK